MIISKTPFRISFFGGGTDYPEWLKKNEGAVLSTTIDRYTYLALKIKSKIFHNKYKITYRRIESANHVSQIKHPAVRECLRYFKIKPGCEIIYNGDLPARSGVGSSSSFTVGLLNCLYALKKIKIDKKKLSEEAIFVERELCKENVGLQDQIACSYGGLNLIKFKQKKFERKKLNLNKEIITKLNENLILCYSGVQRISSDIAKKYVKKLSNRSYEELMNANLDLVNEGINCLKKGNIDDFGKLLDTNWKMKKKLHKEISNVKLDQVYKKALNTGALGGKLLGAGAGGFFLFYVPKKKISKFVSNNKKLFITRFKFENNGSTIINNS
mgnify:CR=1 FL=1